MRLKGAFFMAMLILTILVELVSLSSFFVMLKSRKRKILKWILCGVTAITQVVFWCLAIKYLTVFILSEVTLEIAAVVWYICKPITVLTVDSNKKEKCRKRRKDVILMITFILLEFMFITDMRAYNNNIRWFDKIDLDITTEGITVPENLQELELHFCCVHDAKEQKYDLYWAWDNGIYKISSYTEDECTVYRLSDSRQDLPKLKTNEETFYKYNYNFEIFEEPTLVDTKKEKTYALYVCESSYKEMYTE